MVNPHQASADTLNVHPHVHMSTAMLFICKYLAQIYAQSCEGYEGMIIDMIHSHSRCLHSFLLSVTPHLHEAW